MTYRSNAILALASFIVAPASADTLITLNRHQPYNPDVKFVEIKAAGRQMRVDDHPSAYLLIDFERGVFRRVASGKVKLEASIASQDQVGNEPVQLIRRGAGPTVLGRPTVAVAAQVGSTPCGTAYVTQQRVAALDDFVRFGGALMGRLRPGDTDPCLNTVRNMSKQLAAMGTVLKFDAASGETDYQVLSIADDKTFAAAVFAAPAAAAAAEDMNTRLKREMRNDAYKLYAQRLAADPNFSPREREQALRDIRTQLDAGGTPGYPAPKAGRPQASVDPAVAGASAAVPQPQGPGFDAASAASGTSIRLRRYNPLYKVLADAEAKVAGTRVRIDSSDLPGSATLLDLDRRKLQRVVNGKLSYEASLDQADPSDASADVSATGPGPTLLGRATTQYRISAGASACGTAYVSATRIEALDKYLLGVGNLSLRLDQGVATDNERRCNRVARDARAQLRTAGTLLRYTAAGGEINFEVLEIQEAQRFAPELFAVDGDGKAKDVDSLLQQNFEASAFDRFEKMLAASTVHTQAQKAELHAQAKAALDQGRFIDFMRDQLERERAQRAPAATAASGSSK